MRRSSAVKDPALGADRRGIARLQVTSTDGLFESVLVRIACAECGCLVDRGVVIGGCANHTQCCCGDLPNRVPLDDGSAGDRVGRGLGEPHGSEP